MHYTLENRGAQWIYHWMIYMLGCLRHLKRHTDGKIYFWFPQLHEIDQGYHSESLKLIEDEYVHTPSVDMVSHVHPGEPLIRPDQVDPATYSFLRHLFLNRVHVSLPQLKYYITRKDCHIRNPGNAGKMVRTILNEADMYEGLKARGFQILQFEDIGFEQKIHIFNSAEMIVSPNSGCLTFSLFAGKNTKIVEILPEYIEYHDHYKNICDHLSIPYYRYTDITTIGERPALGTVWNIIVDTHKCLTYIDSIC